VKKGAFVIFAELTAMALILALAVFPIQGSAATVWSDNFEDLNYDGWVVVSGGFTCENGYLESTTEPSDSRIDHPSTVGSGTWSYDCYLVSGRLVFDYYVHPAYTIQLGVAVTPDQIILVNGVAELAYHDGEFDGAWHHIDVTMDESFLIEVFLNDTHIFHRQTLSSELDCENVDFYSNRIGNALDNVVVSDTIDVVCTNGTCEVCPATTTTTSTTTTTTTSTTTTSTTTTTTTTTTDVPPPIPLEIIAIGGGAAVLVIVLVAWKLKT
jgi:hypothetical protein